MKQRSKFTCGLFVLVSAFAAIGFTSGCSAADSEEPSAHERRTDEAVEKQTVTIDEQSVARATRYLTGVIAVVIENREGKALFSAEYRATAATKYHIAYTLYPIQKGSTAS